MLPEQPSIADIQFARKQKKALRAVLDEVNPDIIIHGAARGADTLFAEWGDANGKDVWPYPAKWNRDEFGNYDHMAGHKRNRAMAHVLDEQRKEGAHTLVIATDGGSGTADMKQIARDNGFRIREVHVDRS
jgi:hypothetical protein